MNGVTLHVVEAGPPDGPLLLLLHGFPEFWYGWRHQIGTLAAAGYRVVLPDARAYNLSEVPSRRRRGRQDSRSSPPDVQPDTLSELVRDVTGLIDACGEDRADIVGHDWGGIVAWAVAARHPQRVRKLIVLNAPHPGAMLEELRAGPEQWRRSAYVMFFQLPWLPEALMRAGRFRLLRGTLTGTSRPGTFSDADLTRYERAWARPGALSGMLGWYRALRLARPHRRAARVRVPTLILWGARDAFLRRSLAARSARWCDEARLVTFEPATHWLHLEEPYAVNAHLLDFLGETGA